MRSADGAFAFVSALDADSEGEEGKYYVWSEAEIDRALGNEAGLFKQVYDVTAGGNWEGVTILNRSAGQQLGEPDVETKLAKCRDKLLNVRAKRVPPQRDDKVLADWNGLMIAALAKAGAAFHVPDWVAAAEQVFAFVEGNMTRDDKAGERLCHTWCAGQLRHPAVVDDYANMARAALMLLGVTGKADYLARAQGWVRTADAHYWDADGKGYFLGADDTGDVIARSKTVHDNAVPSGNGVMAEVLVRLYHLTGNAAYRDRADVLLHAVAAKETQQLIHQPTLLGAFELLETGRQVVIVGDADDPATAALVRAAFDAGVVNRTVARVAPGIELPAGHPAHGKGLVKGKSTAYVCAGHSCGLPVTDAAALARDLARP